MNKKLRAGKSSELIVAGELTRHGLDVYLPVVDDQAIDLIIRGNVNSNVQYFDVQVKSVKGYNRIVGFKNVYLFSWDDVLGSDSKRLVDYLVKDLNIGWAKDANIKKINNDKTITVTKNKNSLELKLNEKEDTVLLKNGAGETHEYLSKKENGKLKIYKNVKEKPDRYILIIHYRHENKEDEFFYLTKKQIPDYLKDSKWGDLIFNKQEREKYANQNLIDLAQKIKRGEL